MVDHKFYYTPLLVLGHKHMLVTQFLILRRATLCLLFIAAIGAAASYGAEPTLDQMLRSSTSESKQERYMAIDDLGERHADAGAVVPKLIPMLDDKDPQVRWRTARTLGEYRGQAEQAVDGIRNLLKDSDPIVQYQAAVALGKLGDKSNETIEALINVATSQDPRLARAGIEAIRQLKPNPKRVAEVLGKALKSGDPAVNVQALETIVSEGKKALPFLKEALKNPDTAYVASAAIEELGSAAAETVPELSSLLEKSRHSQMKIQLLLALASIGPDAASAESEIRSQLELSNDVTVPVAAAYALGCVGAKNSDADLKEAAKKGDQFLQMMAIWAIAKIHPDDKAAGKAAIEKLTQALKSDKSAVRGGRGSKLAIVARPAGGGRAVLS